MLKPLAVLALILSVTQASAHTEPPVYNRVNLNESAETEVENDLLVAVLYAQAEGRDAAAPADEVNRKIERAIALAKQHAEIKVQTLSYGTHPIYSKNNIRGWRVNQQLRLESRNAKLLGDVIGELQSDLQVQSIGYEVSTQQRRAQLDTLTGEALRNFEQRAKAVSKALGRSGYRIVRLNINDGRHDGPVPIARGMMMEAQADLAVAAPALEAGTQRMTVSVTGEIELSDD